MKSTIALSTLLLAISSITAQQVAVDGPRLRKYNDEVTVPFHEFHRNLEEPDKCEANHNSHSECLAEDFDTLPACVPYRSPDYCALDESFPLLIQKRTTAVLIEPTEAEKEGHFFQYLDNKIKGYIFSANVAKVRAPQIFFCTSDLVNGLDIFEPPSGDTGFVIRATDLHSSRGIFVLPNGFGGMELLSGMTMSLADVKTALSGLRSTKVIIEEYIEGQETGKLPTEYKIHVFNGEVGSINVVYNRGPKCACWAELDEEWERLDQYGCFTPTGVEKKDDEGVCTLIDFDTGAEKAYPMKGLDMCGPIEKPADCLIQSLMEVAKSVSKQIGAYVRIDMFVSKDGEVVVQEYSTNHMNGLRHCSARLTADGCVDSCFLGKMWNDSGGSSVYGGPPTSSIPQVLLDANKLNDEGLCSMAIESTQAPKFEPACENVPSAAPVYTPSPSIGTQSPSHSPSTVSSAVDKSAEPSVSSSLPLTSKPSAPPGECTVQTTLECTIKATGEPCSKLVCSKADTCDVDVTYKYTIKNIGGDDFVVDDVTPTTLKTQFPASAYSKDEVQVVEEAETINCCKDDTIERTFSVEAITQDAGKKSCGDAQKMAIEVVAASSAPSVKAASSPSNAPSQTSTVTSSSQPSAAPGQCSVRASLECTIQASGKPCSDLVCSKADSCDVPVTYKYSVTNIGGDDFVVDAITPTSLKTQFPALVYGKDEVQVVEEAETINCCKDATITRTFAVEAITQDAGKKPCEDVQKVTIAVVAASSAPSLSPSESPSLRKSSAPSVAKSSAPSVTKSSSPTVKASSSPTIAPSAMPSRPPLLECPTGEREYSLEWDRLGFVSDKADQKLDLQNDLSLFVKVGSSGPGSTSSWKYNSASGCLDFTAGTTLDSSDIVTGNASPGFPTGYGTLQFTFDRQISLAYALANKVGSTSSVADAVRIRAEDIIGSTVNGTYTRTPQSELFFKNNFVYRKDKSEAANDVNSYLTFEPDESFQSIFFDVSAFGYNADDIGKGESGSVCIDLRYCAPPTPVCKDCIKIDFEIDEDGAAVSQGDYMVKQWYDRYGLDISASSSAGCHTSEGPRIFDSSRPGSNLMLGSPSRHCTFPALGGVGEGIGGEEGVAGENCGVGKKNVLILEANNVIANPELPIACESGATSGKITFDYSQGVPDGVDFEFLTILNAKSSGSVELTLKNGQTKSIQYSNLGENSLQRVDVDAAEVLKVEVDMKPGMAIVDIKFCVPCDGVVPPPPPAPVCESECLTLDFDTYPNGTSLEPGTYMKDQWAADYPKGYGVKVSIVPKTASSSWWAPSKDVVGQNVRTPGTYEGRAFDTTNACSYNPGTLPTNGEYKKCSSSRNDQDLATPNRYCPGNDFNNNWYGDGHDNEAGPGAPGENCEPLGNVLIIQEHRATLPTKEWDDAGDGGYVYFEFSQPNGVRFESAGIFDIDFDEANGGNTVELTFTNDQKQEYFYDAYGGNTMQRVNANADNVKMAMVDFGENSASVADVRFCVEVCK